MQFISRLRRQCKTMRTSSFTIILSLAFALLFSIVIGLNADRGQAAEVSATAPSGVAADLQNSPSFPLLRDSVDPWMQQEMLRKLDDLHLTTAIKNQQLAVALVDITDPNQPRMAAANGDSMLYAASLPKIAILLGAFQRAEEGALVLDEVSMDQLTRMIRYSSNADATTMLNRVGKQYLAKLLQSDQYRLYDPEYGGGLWVGKEYAKTRAWKRDPINNLSHGATPVEVARFYYLLDTGRLVSPDSCKKMKSILSEPAISHKFVKGLRAHRPGSKIYRKSGSWGQYHADSAIVERDGRRYIAVALASHPDAHEWLSQIIVVLDDIVFDPANNANFQAANFNS